MHSWLHSPEAGFGPWRGFAASHFQWCLLKVKLENQILTCMKKPATYRITNKALVDKAKSNMLEHAFMAGKARAIINVTHESHATFILPFFVQKTVTVSAHIIEFTN